MKRLIWPGALILLVGIILAIDIVMVFVAIGNPPEIVTPTPAPTTERATP